MNQWCVWRIEGVCECRSYQPSAMTLQLGGRWNFAETVCRATPDCQTEDGKTLVRKTRWDQRTPGDQGRRPFVSVCLPGAGEYKQRQWPSQKQFYPPVLCRSWIKECSGIETSQGYYIKKTITKIPSHLSFRDSRLLLNEKSEFDMQKGCWMSVEENKNLRSSSNLSLGTFPPSLSLSLLYSSDCKGTHSGKQELIPRFLSLFLERAGLVLRSPSVLHHRWMDTWGSRPSLLRRGLSS